MANEPLPAYLAQAKPNPLTSRVPWYASTAPAYFGIFMWIAFYNGLGGALKLGGIGAALAGLVVAALIAHFMFHYVFGLLGMRTGLPLYVVGSSTFGTKGGYLFPGIFMGLLQIGWYSVATYFATSLVLAAFGKPTTVLFGPAEAVKGFDPLFVIVAIAWGYLFALFGAFGIKYVAKISTYLPWIALAMLVIAFVQALPHISKFQTPAETPNALATACVVIGGVIGFFATAGAAGVDFGTASRNADDVNKGGLIGVSLAIIVAGALSILIVAGGQVVEPNAKRFILDSTLPIVSPKLGKTMFIFFAIGSMAPACFCASIIGNSLSTMMPSLSRVALTLGGATIGIVLAALGVAGNLGEFFGLIGASFGPIGGAIVADYLLSGRRWAGPRAGVSIAGYGAWLIGFLVGISNNGIITKKLGHELIPAWHPTPVYAFIVGFVVYAILASIGLQGKPVPYEHTNTQQG